MPLESLQVSAGKVLSTSIEVRCAEREFSSLSLEKGNVVTVR